MKNLYQDILDAKAQKRKLLAILIDPDKTELSNVELLSQKINDSPATHVFVGGSSVENKLTGYCSCP